MVFPDDSGIRQSGWVQTGKYWRYFDTNGVMLANTTQKIDGTSYTFNANGSARINKKKKDVPLGTSFYYIILSAAGRKQIIIVKFRFSLFLLLCCLCALSAGASFFL
jgi:hypothetical protein